MLLGASEVFLGLTEDIWELREVTCRSVRLHGALGRSFGALGRSLGAEGYNFGARGNILEVQEDHLSGEGGQWGAQGGHLGCPKCPLGPTIGQMEHLQVWKVT